MGTLQKGQVYICVSLLCAHLMFFRLHNSSYVAPLELPNGFISHLSPIHPSLIPHSPPHTLTPHSPPPPYPGSYASQPSLQPYLQHQQQQPVFATQQGANYSMNPQIHHPQMTPRVMPHNHFVYQDYDGVLMLTNFLGRSLKIIILCSFSLSHTHRSL